MKILAIEPYYGGSHQAFIDGWIANSEHEWNLLTMPARKWKWRMRGSAMHFANQVSELIENSESYDAIFCCDMLNVSEFKGLLSKQASALPIVVYFHENQLTYPSRFESERDYQFAITNITSALAADEVWFNSQFHMNEFLTASKKLLRKMPDYRCLDVLDTIKAKSSVQHPGTKVEAENSDQNSTDENSEKLRILWAARWEHDKNPEDFFDAIRLLKEKGVSFELAVIGESFRDSPACFAKAKQEFSDVISFWGYQESFKDYCSVLSWADIFVSTANHEFFGLSAVEASIASCWPVLPMRLAYPEVFNAKDAQNKKDFFYDATVPQLVKKISKLAQQKSGNELWKDNPNRLVRKLESYSWQSSAKRLDNAIEAAVEK